MAGGPAETNNEETDMKNDTIYLLVTNEPLNESRLIEVSIDHEGAYPIDPGESVASEHDTLKGAVAAQDCWRIDG